MAHVAEEREFGTFPLDSAYNDRSSVMMISGVGLVSKAL